MLQYTLFCSVITSTVPFITAPGPPLKNQFLFHIIYLFIAVPTNWLKCLESTQWFKTINYVEGTNFTALDEQLDNQNLFGEVR